MMADTLTSLIVMVFDSHHSQRQILRERSVVVGLDQINVNRSMYRCICSKHFVGGNGLTTTLNPNQQLQFLNRYADPSIVFDPLYQKLTRSPIVFFNLPVQIFLFWHLFQPIFVIEHEEYETKWWDNILKTVEIPKIPRPSWHSLPGVICILMPLC